MRTIQFANSVLEWDGQKAPEPLLWMHGGRPKLPASEALLDMEAKLICLIALTRSGALHQRL